MSLRELLEQMVSMNASDLHLTAGSPPVVRVDGRLQRLPNMDILTSEQTKRLAYSMLNEKQKLKFESTWELDFSFGIESMSRFRANMFMQRGNVSVTLPNPHQTDVGRELLARILRQAGVTREDWTRV